MKKITLAAIALTFAACSVDQEATVTDFNGDSVKIQTSFALGTTDVTEENIKVEAARICGKAGKRAEYASTRNNQNTYTREDLFLCL